MYLEAGETYYRSLDYTMTYYYYGAGNFGFEIYDNIVPRTSASRLAGVVFPNYQNMNNTELRHGYVTYTARRTGIHYVGFNGQNFSYLNGDWTFTYTPALDPVCGRGWPKIAGGQAQRVVDAIPQEQLDALPLGRLDFVGMNIYNSVAVRAGADGKPEFCPRAAGHPRTAIGWPITPESMEWGTRFIWERYGLPIYITENGLSCTDSIHLDGKVHDPARIDFIHRYLLSLRRAIDGGVDVRGYFHWSLLDNFEWSEGYNERFGLIYLDYATGKRTPKDSAAWYAKVAETNGKNL